MIFEEKRFESLFCWWFTTMGNRYWREVPSALLFFIVTVASGEYLGDFQLAYESIFIEECMRSVCFRRWCDMWCGTHTYYSCHVHPIERPIDLPLVVAWALVETPIHYF